MHFLGELFRSGGFQPHGYCYQWNSGLVWLHVMSDALIALAYFTIPITLVRFMRKRRDLPFGWMFGLFGLFIVACGATHVLEVWNLWHAQYWLSGAVKGVTAAASVTTAVLLTRLMPQALELPSNVQWIKANAALQKEIQERKELEVEIRLSESKYRDTAELLDLTHDAIVVRNLRNEIVFWNRAAEELYGWNQDEALGRETHQLLRTVFPKPLKEIEGEIAGTGFWEGELIHQRRDDRVLTVSSRWALRRDGRGNAISVLESNRDITQRKREEKKFRNLLETAPDAMVIVDEEGKIVLVNTQSEKMFGYAKSELLNQKVEMLLPKKFREEHVDNRRRFFGEPKVRAMGAGAELYAVRKDQSEFPVEISLSPLETEEGLLVSSAIRDVSERKSAEEKLETQRKELANSNAGLMAANAELESFSYSVSHDLRAPLRTIDGFSHALLEDCGEGLNETCKGHLTRIRAATQRMGMLIDDLLDLSRITRAEMKRQKVDISGMAGAVASELRKSQPERQVELQIEGGLTGTADPGLLRIALANLLSNAWKFTSKRESAHIVVGRSGEGGKPAYFVRDDGAGFDPKYADRLFGAFQRLHSMNDFAGTGVGLATVQRIIHRHGGRVWAESAVDRGATFYFTLSDADS